MATGTVSSISGDNWQLIATNTPTSGTSSSFSSLSGYKKYMLVFDTVVVSATGLYGLVVKFNGSSTKYAAGSYLANAAASSSNVSDVKIPLYPYSFYDTTTSGWLEINNPNLAIPKTVEGYSYGNGTGYLANTKGGWLDTSVLTSVEVTTWGGTATFSSGTIKLYGIAE